MRWNALVDQHNDGQPGDPAFAAIRHNMKQCASDIAKDDGVLESLRKFNKDSPNVLQPELAKALAAPDFKRAMEYAIDHPVRQQVRAQEQGWSR